MTIITESVNEVCKRMTLEDFKEKCTGHVRNANHMNLVDTWEKHIIYQAYEKGSSIIDGLQSFYCNIYYADETYRETPLINVYLFSYHDLYLMDDSGTFICEDGSLYEESILAISKFFTCFNANKNRFFDHTLDVFHNTG